MGCCKFQGGGRKRTHIYILLLGEREKEKKNRVSLSPPISHVFQVCLTASWKSL